MIWHFDEWIWQIDELNIKKLELKRQSVEMLKNGRFQYIMHIGIERMADWWVISGKMMSCHIMTNWWVKIKVIACNWDFKYNCDVANKKHATAIREITMAIRKKDEN